MSCLPHILKSSKLGKQLGLTKDTAFNTIAEIRELIDNKNQPTEIKPKIDSSKKIEDRINVEDEEKLVKELGDIKLSINTISNIDFKTGSIERKMETFMSDLLQDFRHLESYDLSDLEPLFGKNIADKLLALKPLIREFVKTDFLAMNSETRTKSAIIEAFNLKKQILSSITDLINPISKNLIKQEFTQEQPIVEETKEEEKDGCISPL